MNPVKVLIVGGILLFGLILYAVFVPSPTIAAECTSYDATVAVIRAQGHHPFFIAPAKLPEIVAEAEAVTEESYGVATRGFMLVGNTKTVLGLEVSGCLLDPIYLLNAKPVAGA